MKRGLLVALFACFVIGPAIYFLRSHFFGGRDPILHHADGNSEKKQFKESYTSLRGIDNLLPPKTFATVRETQFEEKVPRANAWDEITKALLNYQDLSQNELEEHYQKTARLLEIDERHALRHIQMQIPRYIRKDLAEGFFMIQTWMKSRLNPVEVLDAIISYPPPSEGTNLPSHHATTDLERFRKLQSFALQEMQKKIQEGKARFNNVEQSKFVEHLQIVAQTEKSWDVLLEVFETLLQMKETKVLEATLAKYPDKDREFFSAYLNLSDY